jgi:hypothetical protein
MLHPVAGDVKVMDIADADIGGGAWALVHGEHVQDIHGKQLASRLFAFLRP